MHRILHPLLWLILALQQLSGLHGLQAQATKITGHGSVTVHSPIDLLAERGQANEVRSLRIDLTGYQESEQQNRLLLWLEEHFPVSVYHGLTWKAGEVRTSLGGKHFTFDQLYIGRPIPGHGVKFTVNRKGIAVMASIRVYIPNLSTELSDIESMLHYKPVASETFKALAAADFGGYVIESEAAWWIEADGSLRAAYRVCTLEDQKGGSHEIWYDQQTTQRIAIFPRWCNHTAESGKGRGRVFRPDPLTSGRVFYRRGTPYADNGNVNNNFFEQQYVEVELKDLRIGLGGHELSGPYVHIEDIAPPAYPSVTSQDGRFIFDRSQVGFEQVSAYYHIDAFQRYVQELGFDNLGHRPLRVDAHGFRDDNSAFFPGGAQSYILMGEGGVDDAEDADVLIHEYLHALSDHASPRTRNGTERRGLDEGFGDYFAASWSRAMGEFRWNDIFTWDGHNEFWTGRTATYDRMNYPEMKALSWQGDYIYLLGQLWATAMMRVWETAGQTATDRIVLQTLYLTQNNMTLAQAAHASIIADSLLHNGENTRALLKAFCELAILEGQACEVLSITPRTQASGFRLYPNPSNGDIYIHYEPTAGWLPLELRLVDLTGRTRLETFLYGNRMRIDATHLPDGVYIVEIHQSGMPVWTEKLIVHN